MAIGAPCPICGDPRGFPLWIAPQPPDRCPEDYQHGGEPRVRSVADCRYQMEKARDAAERRKVAPECFDADGTVLPGRSAEMLGTWLRWKEARALSSSPRQD